MIMLHNRSSKFESTFPGRKYCFDYLCILEHTLNAFIVHSSLLALFYLQMHLWPCGWSSALTLTTLHPWVVPIFVKDFEKWWQYSVSSTLVYLWQYICTDLIPNDQDFKPQIHISESDFATITLDGTLCNSVGKLGAEQFETVFRRLLKLYTQRQVCLSM